MNTFLFFIIQDCFFFCILLPFFKFTFALQIEDINEKVFSELTAITVTIPMFEDKNHSLWLLKTGAT